MKIRQGFVSNSSSTSFIITNKTNKDLTIVDFVKENPQLIELYVDRYKYEGEEGYTQEALIDSAYAYENSDIPAKSSDEYVFGDEQGTLIGRVFDYILRDGGESKSFRWKFYQWYR